ncbi:MAG: biliverdin-producing heme oxygenase [Chitinophagaceae bacterium]|nr:MAG: biliverdin-producing heme oxygenase [Chitinophagaceae bacterium]
MVQPDPQPAAALRLKEDTRRVHETLEARLLPYLEAVTDADTYAHLLRAFHSYYAALEKAVAKVLRPDALPDFTQRRKAEWLLLDLEALGRPTHDRELPASLLPAIDDEAAAWGALYVLEGSTLGGRLICRMLDKQLPGAPLRFFGGYGAQTGPYWMAFLGAFEKAAPGLSYDAILRAATHTFQSLDLWLQQQLLPATRTV